MLVLTRKKEEMIRIDGNITIKILEIDNRQVRIGIEAPRHIRVNREEVYQRILEENRAASCGAAAGGGLLEIAELLRGNENN